MNNDAMKYHRMVRKIVNSVKRKTSCGCSYPDLYQSGMLGAVLALRAYKTPSPASEATFVYKGILFRVLADVKRYEHQPQISTIDDIAYFESAVDISDVLGALDKLTENERMVIKKRFSIGCKKHLLKSIARELKCTRENVRQIEKKALGRLSEIVKHLQA